MSTENVITQKMRDYWAISEVLDAGIPYKEDEESGLVTTWGDEGTHYQVPLKDCVEANWDCCKCRKQAVKICLCDMELWCWTHLNKHTKDSVKIVVKE